MDFLFNNITDSGINISADMTNIVTRLIFTAVTVILALSIGLLLRRLLVRRLKKTVLDNWLIQTLGILVIIPPLIIGTLIALAIWNTLDSSLRGFLGHYGLTPEDLTARVFETVILLALAIGIARTFNSLTVRGLHENRVDINLRILIGRIFYIITMIIACFWIFSIWQISLTSLVAVASVLTVAASFAVQDILKDLVAGLYLLFERPFFIGDQITVPIAPTLIYVGRVEDVRLRATRLRLVGGEEITIPNAILFGNAVLNNTYYGERRATVVVTLPQADFSRAETAKSIIQTLKGLNTVIEKPEPVVLFNSITDGKVKLVARFWLASGQILDISDAIYALHDLLPTAELLSREPDGIV